MTQHVSYWTYSHDPFETGCSQHDSALDDVRFSTKERLIEWLKENMKPTFKTHTFRAFQPFELIGFGQVENRQTGSQPRLVQGEIKIFEDEKHPDYLIYTCQDLIEIIREWEEVVQREIKEEGKPYVPEVKKPKREILLEATPLYEAVDWSHHHVAWVIDPDKASRFDNVNPCICKVFVKLIHVEFDILD